MSELSLNEFDATILQFLGNACTKKTSAQVQRVKVSSSNDPVYKKARHVQVNSCVAAVVVHFHILRASIQIENRENIDSSVVNQISNLLETFATENAALFKFFVSFTPSPTPVALIKSESNFDTCATRLFEGMQKLLQLCYLTMDGV